MPSAVPVCTKVRRYIWVLRAHVLDVIFGDVASTINHGKAGLPMLGASEIVQWKSVMNFKVMVHSGQAKPVNTYCSQRQTDNGRQIDSVSVWSKISTTCLGTDRRRT